MVSARQKAGVQGVDKVRRRLRRLPKEYTEGIKTAVREGLERIAADMATLAPRDEGDLIAAITTKLSSDKLAGIAGPGARAAEIIRRKTGSRFGIASLQVNISKATERGYMQFVKGYWIEFGTKGYPPKNIPPMPARPFAGPAADLNRAAILERARKEIERAIERAWQRR